MKHYIPVKRDLSDLVDRIKWAQSNDAKALQIAKAARKFVNEHLLPTDVFCYHVRLFEVIACQDRFSVEFDTRPFQEWSKRLSSDVVVQPDMELVPDSDHDVDCPCRRSRNHFKDEL